jgi:isocitrate dehydrogenase kinase/phosphatase
MLRDGLGRAETRPVTLTPALSLTAARGADTVRRAYDAYLRQFREITGRAASRQERHDWHGIQRDNRDRLDLHVGFVREAITDLHELLGPDVRNRAAWAEAKHLYAEALGDRADYELRETFFNSVTRRLFSTVGVDADVEFADSDYDRPRRPAPRPAFTTYPWPATTTALVARLLESRRVANRPITFDAERIADIIDAHRRHAWGAQPIESVDFLEPVFYRNKGAYLIGRLRGAARLLPLVIALVSKEDRVVVDAVLLSEDDVSIVFSFTRSYFLVAVDSPHDTIMFLRSIMPAKRVAELYISLGYDRHGKAELFRDLARHLSGSADRFEFAAGDRGMVMIVFTLPSYDVVLKVIRDRFAYPKQTTRRQVLERYELVFRHDRAGRLVDAQEFEHLTFPHDRFTADLLAELRDEAADTVTVVGDRVVVRHLYIERRVRPLNLYLREAEPAAARQAVLDFGQTIKDLAATNIFPGDVLLKNFGVTRHGRVIFYDYDELSTLTDCNFRRMPEPRTLEEEMAAEPWFYVGPHDLFPEEFPRFLGLYGELRDVFLKAHGDLFGTAFWIDMQTLHRTGEIVDIFPYDEHHRLRA